MKGELWLIGTPIGNLGDMTFRAVDSLKSASRIYAEDTRRTRALLSHFGIEGKALSSLHAHSPDRDIQAAISIMNEGHHVAMVTDAGMPSVSDPGTELVRAARHAGLVVRVIPGVSAVTTAVALSGLIDSGFSFVGFLPRKGPKRRRALEHIAHSELPVVLFESPHRVKDTLLDLSGSCEPERSVAICRELTKKFEETRVVTLAETQSEGFSLNPQGEFSLVVEGAPNVQRSDDGFDVHERARSLLARGDSVRDVATQLLEESSRAGLKRSRRDLYALVQQLQQSPADPES